VGGSHPVCKPGVAEKLDMCVEGETFRFLLTKKHN